MAELRTVALGDIRPSLNARGRIGDVDELALSLKVLGLQKPLIVMPRPGDGYDILDGHRRHAAAVKAGLTSVDVIVRTDPGEAGRLQAQLAMHTHAKGFDPMAESRALHTLMFDHNLSREQISRAIGRTPAWVRDRISLVHLTATEQRQLAEGTLSVAEALFRLAARRAERDGTPPPKPTGWNGNGGNGANKPFRVPHFCGSHPLVNAASTACAAAGHTARKIASACGPCWEAAIRTDALAGAR